MTAKTGSIAVLTKTPGFSPLKTRLAQAIGKDLAEIFHGLSISRIETTLFGLKSEIIPYWAIAEQEAESAPIWKSFSRVVQEGESLGERLHYVYSTLQQRHPFVLLIGSDSPHIEQSLIRSAIYKLTSTPAKFIMGECADGGFYLFGGSEPVSESDWKSVRYSADSTASELAARISMLGELEYLPKSFDVDTFEDLRVFYAQCLKSPDLMKIYESFFDRLDSGKGIQCLKT